MLKKKSTCTSLLQSILFIRVRAHTPTHNILIVSLPHARRPWGEVTHAGCTRVRCSRSYLLWDSGERLLALIKMWGFGCAADTSALLATQTSISWSPSAAWWSDLRSWSPRCRRRSSSARCAPSAPAWRWTAGASRSRLCAETVTTPTAWRSSTTARCSQTNRWWEGCRGWRVWGRGGGTGGCWGSLHNGADCHAANDA